MTTRLQPRPYVRKATLAFLLLATLAAAVPAAAQVGVYAEMSDHLIFDADASGDASCGDHIFYGVDLGGADGGGDLHDVELDLPIDPNSTIVAGTLAANNPNGTVTVLSGNQASDTRVRVRFGTVCTTPASCTQRGATVFFRVRIRQPNSGSRLSVQGILTGSNFPPTATDDTGTPAPFDPVVTTYTPCPFGDPDPGPGAPVLDATKQDVLVLDRDGDGLVDAGDRVRYVVRVRNGAPGSSPAGGVVFSSNAPAGARLLAGSVTTTRGSVTTGNGPGHTQVAVAIGALPALAAADITFDVEVDIPVPPGQTQLSCQGTATADGLRPVPTDDPATPAPSDPTLTPLDFDPDLSLSKSDGGGSTRPGSLAPWTLAITEQSGRSPASGVRLTETVPAHTRFVAAASSPGWSCPNLAPPGTACTLVVGTLAAGGAASRTFATLVDTPLPAGVTQIANSAAVADDGTHGPDPDLSDNLASDTTPIEGQGAAPDLAVTKDDGGASADAGAVVAYALTYTNQGTRGATDVLLTDTVPAHTAFFAPSSTAGWSCPDGAPAGSACTLRVGTLPAGTGGSALFAVRVAASLPPEVTEIVNTLTIADDGTNGTDPDPANNTDTETTPVDLSTPDLLVTKDDGGVEAAPGQLVAYTLAYANAGRRTASGSLLTETVPAHTTFAPEASSPGWDCAPRAPAGTPCTLSLGTLAPDALGSVAFAVRVDDPLPAGVSFLTNFASIGDDGTAGPDADPSNNSDSEVTPVGGPGAAPDLALAKTDDGATVTPGGLAVYRLTATNLGHRGASGVTLTDTVPGHSSFAAATSSSGWSCPDAAPAGTACSLDLGTLEAGDDTSATFAVRLSPGVPPEVTHLANQAAVADDGDNGTDPDLTNNQATDSTPIERPTLPGGPTLSATKVDTPDPAGDGEASPGETIAYTVVVTNLGEDTALQVEFSTAAPAHTALFVGTVATTHGTITTGNAPGDTAVRVALGSLAPGEEAVVTFEVIIDGNLPPGVLEIACQGTVFATALDPVVTDDPDTTEPLDPTRTPLVFPDDPGGPGGPHDIPTAGTLGLLALVLALATVALRRLRLQVR